jgi:hypothetical protein
LIEIHRKQSALSGQHSAGAFADGIVNHEGHIGTRRNAIWRNFWRVSQENCRFTTEF